MTGPALTFLAVTALVGVVPGLAGCRQEGVPHVDHVTLPTHRTWRVVSVQPYQGLAEVELVKFDWPTREEPSIVDVESERLVELRELSECAVNGIDHVDGSDGRDVGLSRLS